MKKTGLILFLAFLCFMGCQSQPKSVDKDGGLVVRVEIPEGLSFNEAPDFIANILKKRLDSFYPKNNTSVKFAPDGNLFILELPAVDSTGFYPDLIESYGRFEIMGMVQSGEFWNRITQYSNYTDNDTLSFLKRYDSYAAGVAHASDTAMLNTFFRELPVKKLFLQYSPVFTWGMPLETSGFYDEKDILPLYCLKKSENNIQLNRAFRDVSVEKDYQGFTYFNIKLKDEYSKEFEILTEDNIGLPLPVVLDNRVVSAPIVNGIITGGSLSISGNFSDRQLSVFEALLKSGIIKTTLKVSEIKYHKK